MTTLLAAFGWAVLHLAWQGTLVWVVWRAYLRWTARAEERYAGGAVAFVAISVLFAGTVAFYFGAVTPELLQAPVDALVPPALNYGYQIGGVPVVDRAAVASGAVWLAVSCVLLARVVPGWRRGRRLCERGAAPAHPDVAALVATLTPECGLRRTPGARQSVHIDSPAVFGALRMVLLFPSSGLDRLTQAQLRGVVAHELMHVRRLDGIANVVQCVLDALLWFHPAARDISRTVRVEREIVCDTRAASVSGDAREYVSGLLKLEEARPRGGRLALAVRDGDLLQRARRLLTPVPSAPAMPRSLAAAVAALTLVLAAAGAWPSSAGAGALRNAPHEYTVNAVDPAGQFALTVRRGRAVAASIDGRAMPQNHIVQRRDSVYVFDQSGNPTVAVRVMLAGGIRWAARPPSP